MTRRRTLSRLTGVLALVGALAAAFGAPAVLNAQPTVDDDTLPMVTVPDLPVDTTAVPISLDDAVRLAQRNAPAAVQAQGQLRSSSASVHSAYSAFIPSLSVSMGSSRSFADSRTINQNGQIITLPSAPWSYSSGLSTSLDLFDGGRRLFQVRTARANVSAAEANDVAQRFNVALAVKQQYFAVLAARESQAAAQAQLKQASVQLNAAIARVRAGAATKSDSLRSVIQMGNAQLALLTAQNNLRVSNAALTRLVGAPRLVTAAEDDTLPPAELAVDSAALAQLALQGPTLRQAEANLAAARASSRAARTPYLPSLSMSYSRGGSGTDSRFGFGVDSAYRYSGRLAFSLSYPLFNQFNREESAIRADVAETNAEANLRDARLAAQQNLVQYLGALRTAEQRIQIQLASVAAAEEDLRVQQQRYALGASTLLDVLTSQTQLDQARMALIQARYDYRVARAQLESLVGRNL